MASRDQDLARCVKKALARWAVDYFATREQWRRVEYEVGLNICADRERLESLPEEHRKYASQHFYANHPKEPLPRTVWRCRWEDVPNLVAAKKAHLFRGFVYLFAHDAHVWFPEVLFGRLSKRFKELDDRLNKIYPDYTWVPSCDPVTISSIINEKKNATHDDLETTADRISYAISDAYAFWKREQEERARWRENARQERAKVTDPHMQLAFKAYQKAEMPPRNAFLSAFGKILPPCIAFPLGNAINERKHLQHAQRNLVFPFLAHVGVPLEITKAMWRDIYSHSTSKGDKGKQKHLDAYPSELYAFQQNIDRNPNTKGFRSCESVSKNSAGCCPFSEKHELVADIEDANMARQLQCKAVTDYPGNWYLSPASLTRRQLVIAYEV